MELPLPLLSNHIVFRILSVVNVCLNGSLNEDRITSLCIPCVKVESESALITCLNWVIFRQVTKAEIPIK